MLGPALDRFMRYAIHQLSGVASWIKTGFFRFSWHLASSPEAAAMLHEPLAMGIDFGTNSEKALKLGSRILVGSVAAGQAIEGQHISRGMLAANGAISDLEYDWGWDDMV